MMSFKRRFKNLKLILITNEANNLQPSMAIWWIWGQYKFVCERKIPCQRKYLVFIKINVPLRPLIFNVGVFQFCSGQIVMPTAGEGGCSEPGVLFSLWTEEGSTLYTDRYGPWVFRGTLEKAESEFKATMHCTLLPLCSKALHKLFTHSDLWSNPEVVVCGSL